MAEFTTVSEFYEGYGNIKTRKRVKRTWWRRIKSWFFIKRMWLKGYEPVAYCHVTDEYLFDKMRSRDYDPEFEKIEFQVEEQDRLAWWSSEDSMRKRARIRAFRSLSR
jgi:hypothetical protein